MRAAVGSGPVKAKDVDDPKQLPPTTTAAEVTAELAAEVKRKARQRRSFLAWADDLPWERFCTVVAIVSGEIQP